MKHVLFSFDTKAVLACAALAMTSGCSYLPDTVSPALDSYRAYAQSSAQTSAQPGASEQQLELVNSELQLTLNDRQLKDRQLTEQQRYQINRFIQQQGGRYKQRIAVSANVASLQPIADELDKLLSMQGITADNRRFLANEQLPSQQVKMVSEYFQVASQPCQTQQKVRIGCATQHNLALSLPDPVQLIRGRQLAGADGVKAINAIQKYRTGETAAADTNTTDFFER
ncbi:hypothetical protein DXX93_04820 [Thalassotalea euphylliae]|uniref:Pilus assembly protein CpaD n=1 Tax=Thalassotalea euphylliae TaxID=1655234 RepID=A0A3E0TNT8_9GAMM|nr:CpaD family pilus assembly lipoprotein [Thalassotalea euphylliae]REL25950.1 hypothetical protein DXX93_04820 [Thalassotalea euphylliae]